MTSPHTLRVVILEDDREDTLLLKHFLGKIPQYHFQITAFTRTAEAADYLRSQKHENVDAVFCDLSLPDTQGQATVDRLLQSGHKAPLIVLTGLKDDTLALEIISQGAQDFLKKGEFDETTLARSLLYARARQQSLLLQNQPHHEIPKTPDNHFQKTLSKSFHDVMGAITNIYGVLQLFEYGDVAKMTDDGVKYLGIAHRSTDILANKMKQIRYYTLLKSQSLPLRQERLNWQETFDSLIKSESAFAAKQNKSLRFEPSGEMTSPTHIHADRQHLPLALGSLMRIICLNSACEIAVTVKRHDNEIFLRFDNDGGPFDVEQLETNLDNCYTLDTDKTEGWFCYPVSRLLIEQCGGRVKCLNRPEDTPTKRGTPIEVSLPLAA